MTVQCMFDTNSGAGYRRKPPSSKAGLVRKRMRTATVSEADFLFAVDNGYAWTPGVLVGGMSRANWRSQQIIGLDFDNKGLAITAEAAVGRLVDAGITPAVLYHTYSATPDNPRFRIVLFLDEPCEDPDVMETAIGRLLALFPEADPKCKDLARFFYGCWHSALPLFERDGYRRTDIRTILGLPESAGEKPGNAGKRARRRSPGPSLSEIKEGYDLVTRIREDTGEHGRMSGNCMRFVKCPICGHNDCFAYYPSTNTWACFSSSNTTGVAGGSAIDYLIAREGLTVASAIALLENEIGAV